MARIVTILKVTNNIVGIAIHQANNNVNKIALGVVVFEICWHLY